MSRAASAAEAGGGSEVVVHAMKMRAKYAPLLGQRGLDDA